MAKNTDGVWLILNRSPSRFQRTSLDLHDELSVDPKKMDDTAPLVSRLETRDIRYN